MIKCQLSPKRKWKGHKLCYFCLFSLDYFLLIIIVRCFKRLIVTGWNIYTILYLRYNRALLSASYNTIASSHFTLRFIAIEFTTFSFIKSLEGLAIKGMTQTIATATTTINTKATQATSDGSFEPSNPESSCS